VRKTGVPCPNLLGNVFRDVYTRGAEALAPGEDPGPGSPPKSSKTGDLRPCKCQFTFPFQVPCHLNAGWNAQTRGTRALPRPNTTLLLRRPSLLHCQMVRCTWRGGGQCGGGQKENALAEGNRLESGEEPLWLVGAAGTGAAVCGMGAGARSPATAGTRFGGGASSSHEVCPRKLVKPAAGMVALPRVSQQGCEPAGGGCS